MALKTVYVIPYDAGNVQNLRTVNIKTVDPGRGGSGPPAAFPHWRQSFIPPASHEFATVMAAGDANSNVALVGNCHISTYNSGTSNYTTEGSMSIYVADDGSSPYVQEA